MVVLRKQTHQKLVKKGQSSAAPASAPAPAPSAETISFLCPSCQKMHTVSAEFGGQIASCDACDCQFTIPAAPAQPPPPVTQTPAHDTGAVKDELEQIAASVAQIEESIGQWIPYLQEQNEALRARVEALEAQLNAQQPVVVSAVAVEAAVNS